MSKYPGKCPEIREVDLYTGCSFNCLYCIAHSRHAREVSPTEIERDLFSSPPSTIPLCISPWTDPYPPCEEDEFRTGRLVRHLARTGQPFYIMTRSLLVKRDVEAIRDRAESFLAISLNSLDDNMTTLLEPGAPGAGERAAMIGEMAALPGLRTVVRVDPIIPGVTHESMFTSMLPWLRSVKPFAAGFETLRLTASIASRLESVLSSELFRSMISHYPALGNEPAHPRDDWRLPLFMRIVEAMEGSSIRACFCRATTGGITPWDCRGGY